MRLATAEAPHMDVSATIRAFGHRTSALVAGFTGAITGTLGVMHGGYFSTAWGWGSLACLWVALMALVHSERLLPGPLELAFAGTLGLFLMWIGFSAIWSESASATVREVERGVLVLSAVAAAMLLAGRHMRPILSGLL